eukprot:COSAG06_NODE_584_length_14005_cov_23.423486_8_plen_50_part_00
MHMARMWDSSLGHDFEAGSAAAAAAAASSSSSSGAHLGSVFVSNFCCGN